MIFKSVYLTFLTSLCGLLFGVSSKGVMDFNYQAFLSNLVVRWEYDPGSSVYLIWSQTRNSSSSAGNLDLFNDLGNLFSTVDNKPHNVFLIKFSYRFGLK